MKEEKKEWISPKWKDRIDKLTLAVGLSAGLFFIGNATTSQYSQNPNHEKMGDQRYYYMQGIDAPDWITDKNQQSEPGDKDYLRDETLKKQLIDVFNTKVKDKPIQANVNNSYQIVYKHPDENSTSGTDPKEFSKQVANIFRERLKQSNMPHSPEKIEEIINNITFHSADIPDGMNVAGFMTNDGKHIVVDPDKTIIQGYPQLSIQPEDWASIMVHEVGHAFGLSEGLTCLFTEQVMGPYHNVSDANWLYNCDFEKYLLKHPDVDPKTFWEAAFTSNEAFAKLWNKHVDFITYEELIMMRTVNERLQDKKYSKEFEKHFGTNWKQSYEKNFLNFVKIKDNERKQQTYDAEDKETAKINEMKENSQGVVRSIDELIIAQHRMEGREDEAKAREEKMKQEEQQRIKDRAELKTEKQANLESFRKYIDNTKKFTQTMGKSNFAPSSSIRFMDELMYPQELEKVKNQYFKQLNSGQLQSPNKEVDSKLIALGLFIMTISTGNSLYNRRQKLNDQQTQSQQPQTQSEPELGI